MVQKKREHKAIEFGGQPGPINNPKLLRIRLFFDLFVIGLAIIGFLLFIFVIITSKMFLSVLVFCALYTYLFRKYI